MPPMPDSAHASAAASAPAVAFALPQAGVVSPPAAQADTATLAVAPYGPQVAARFPEPATGYSTPALAKGRSDFTSAAELQSLLRGWVRDGGSAPGGLHVRLLAVGVSRAGTPIEGLLYTRSRDAALEHVLADRRPTVILVGQQRGDAPAAAEGLLVVAEQLARGPLQSVLDRINVVLVPRVDADGALRRPAADPGAIDIGSDHLLLRTPEARAIAQLVRNYKATVVVDFEEYPVSGRFVERFGAVPRGDAQLQTAMTGNLPEFLTRAAEEWFREPLVAALGREQLSTEWHHRPAGGADERRLAMGSPRPDSLRNSSGLRNAVGLLVESRGGDLGRSHLLRRVHTQVVAAGSVLNSAASRAPDLVKLRQYLDGEVAGQACRGRMLLDARTTPSEYSLTMLDPSTGADRSVAVAWDSALALQPGVRRARPCGYWIAAEQTEAVQGLRELGLNVMQVTEAGQMTGEKYREADRSGVDAATGISQRRPTTRSTLVPGALDVAPGSYYVPLAQPLANLAIAALEPDTPYGYHAQRLVNRLPAVARVTAVPDQRLFGSP